MSKHSDEDQIAQMDAVIAALNDLSAHVKEQNACFPCSAMKMMAVLATMVAVKYEIEIEEVLEDVVVIAEKHFEVVDVSDELTEEERKELKHHTFSHEAKPGDDKLH